MFLTGDGSGGTGSSGNNKPCQNKQYGAFAYYGSFTHSSFAKVNLTFAEVLRCQVIIA